jgi:pimeloyl-ACP methyl ester carboxylesterase
MFLVCQQSQAGDERLVDDPFQSNLAQIAPKLSLKTRTGEIYYRDTAGAGETLVMLHPFSGTQDSWAHQFADFKNAGYRVIAIAQRGSGEQDIQGYFQSSLAEDTLILLKHLKIDEAHLVGSAAGGIEALRFAADYPKKVLSLILVNSMAGASPEEFIDVQKRVFMPSSLAVEFKALSPDYRYLNSESVKTWLNIYGESVAAKMSSITREQKAALFKKMLSGLVSKEQIAALDLPVLLLYGGADLVVPPTFGRNRPPLFKNAQLRFIPQMGHHVHWEAPEEFNAILLEFLADKID